MTVAAVKHSALYVGSVRHRRHGPVTNRFTYDHAMLYLDLDEIDVVFEREPLVSTGRANFAWFRRSDYLGDANVPLDDAVRRLVADQTGARPSGPIRMLTQLRTLGYLFNPVTFYYCFDAADTRVETIVAEITNTPWLERHAYVLSRDQAEIRGRRQRFRFAKAFHVSPFLPMDLLHDWHFAEPGDRLHVHMEDLREGEVVLDATLAMRRVPLGGRRYTRHLLTHPLVTFKVTAGIYAQALRLWWKRCPFFAHPRHAARQTHADSQARRPSADARAHRAPGAPADRTHAGALPPARVHRGHAPHS